MSEKPVRNAKWAILMCEKHHISARNWAYREVIKPISHLNKGSFAKRGNRYYNKKMRNSHYIRQLRDFTRIVCTRPNVHLLENIRVMRGLL